MKNIFFSLCFLATISYSQYSLTVEKFSGAKKAGEDNSIRVVLLYNGTAINTIERKLPFDVPFPASYINETTGIFILSFPFDGFVEVYNGKGNKIWTKNFFKEMSPNYERTITIALGSSKIGFLTSDVRLPNAIAHRFTIDGKQQWETVLPHSIGYEIALSPDEQMMIAGSYFVLEDEVRQSASIINTKGTIIGDVDILFRKAAFSVDGKFTALSTDREIVVVSTETNKELYRKSKQTNGIITDIIWNGNSLIVQESEVKTTPEHTFYYANPIFIEYSSELKKLNEQRFVDENFKSAQLKIKNGSIEFTRNGKSSVLLK